ncbi:hypothetical protein BN1110_02984 [bacterium YEK0313]|nr:hypothetical protein BN1110_02984 [bacterium YEK0313]
MEETSFQLLRDAPLHRFTPAEWTGWYPRVAAHLAGEDPATRAAALERLVMAVFRAEPGTLSGPERDAHARDRAVWFLETLAAAQRRHPELLAAFLEHLRWHGDDEPFPAVLLPWLRALRAQRLPEVPGDRIDAAELLIGGLAWTDRGDLPALFDHASDYVRSCAACMFGRQGLAYGDGDQDVMDPDIIDRLTAKELERPGLAGPFWSGCMFFGDYDGFGRDPVAWMLDIIERRNGPEPADMAANGIDFHIHELAAGDPAAIRRLARSGRTGLALMAATEIHDAVPAVAPVLRELAGHADRDIAWGAQAHLARYYGEAHPAAPPERLKYLPGSRLGVDALVIRYGEAPRWSDLAVFFPSGRDAFDTDEAWSVIDAAMPPEARGDIEKHPLARHDDGAGPVRVARNEHRSYAHCQIVLSGEPEAQRWQRIEMGARHRSDHWRPFQWGGPARSS